MHAQPPQTIIHSMKEYQITERVLPCCVMRFSYLICYISFEGKKAQTLPKIAFIISSREEVLRVKE